MAAAPSGHGSATAEAAAVASAGTRPLAELLASGLAAMHELLGRYRWCSQQYLQGQVCVLLDDLPCVASAYALSCAMLRGVQWECGRKN
jgi:hypothetical protein